MFDREPFLIGMGGSIPAVEAIKRLLGMDSLLVGFGLKDDLVHSPNEKFELRCFEAGMQTHARLLAELAQISAEAARALDVAEALPATVSASQRTGRLRPSS